MGSIETYSRRYAEAESMLQRAEAAMVDCGSNLGKATVHHNMGILRCVCTPVGVHRCPKCKKVTCDS